jgi:cation transport regulator ChaC
MEQEKNLEYDPKIISEDILSLDNNILLIKERINEITLNMKDIESVVEQGVISDESFKNERSRRLEIDKRLAGNITYTSLKDQEKTIIAERNNQEVRKKYSERSYKISLNTDEKLGEYLISLNTGINDLDQERIESENRLDKIAKEIAEKRNELGKKIEKKKDIFKNKEEESKAFIELLQKDETLKNIQKEIEEINQRLKYIVSERQDNERKIKIEGIIKGVRI